MGCFPKADESLRRAGGVSQLLTKADKGGGGVSQKLTFADRGGGVYEPPFLAHEICEQPLSIIKH